MSHVHINPITQAINFRVDAEGIHVHCTIEVTDEKKYPFDKMAALARYIRTDIEDDIVLLDGNEEEPDDTL